MRRISLVGVSGSGKTTIGRQLAATLGVPFIELDSIFHQSGWTELPHDEFRRRVNEALTADAWVVDGNYSAVLDLVWQRADTVVHPQYLARYEAAMHDPAFPHLHFVRLRSQTAIDSFII